MGRLNLALVVVILSGCALNPVNEQASLEIDDQDSASETAEVDANIEEPAIRLPPELIEIDPLLASDDEAAKFIEAALTQAIETSLADRLLTTPIPTTALPTLWDRLVAGFTFEPIDHPRITSELRWYEEHPAYMERVTKRASRYLSFIIAEIEARNMPLEIALLPIVESAFQPFAYSHGRAAGMWQFIPATGRMYDLKQNWWYDGRRDIVASTRAALDYLQKLHKFVGGDWLLALAAYNSGAGTVLKAIRKNKRRGKSTDFWSLNLPKETKAYVPRLLALASIARDPGCHGLELTEIEDKPYFAIVETKGQIDLALAAELADMSMEEFYFLNPAFNRWATDPDGPHRLLVPIEKAEAFALQLAELPTKEQLKWKRYRIKPGDSLLLIAQRYRTTVDLLKRVNNLRGNTIRAGRHLVIPVAAKSLNSYRFSANQRRKSIQNQPRIGNKQRYTVLRGDTLWDISRKFDVSVSALAKWNGMAPRDPLHPGQKLVIWSRDKFTSLSTRAPRSQTVQTINYTVRRGDSLARISRKFNVTLADLRRWNRLPAGKYLQPGQRLTLRVDITDQSS